MNIEEKEGQVVVHFEDYRVSYSEEFFGEEPYLTSDGVVNLVEWKIDLIKNHGVDLDELQG